MDTKKIGAFLKQCRKEKNLTQEQLAEKFGVSARTVSRWETGINMPDLSVLVQLAEYYDVGMRELCDGLGLGVEAAPEVLILSKVRL